MTVALGFVILYFASGANPRSSLRQETDVTAHAVGQVTQSVEQGSASRKLSLVVLGCIALLGVVTTSKQYKISRQLAYAGAFFVGFCFVSLLWSDEPGITVRRLLVFLLLYSGAVGLAWRYTTDEIISIALGVASILVVVAVACELSLGSFSPLSPQYRFSGLYHPNLQGGDCSILVLAGMAITIRTGTLRYIPLILLSAILIVLTKSRGCLAAATLGAGVLLFLTANRRQRIVLTSTLVATVSLLVIVFHNNLEQTLYSAVLLGRTKLDPTELTGRSSLWSVCFEYFSSRPLLGYGFEAFWNSERILLISERENWIIPNSHNGFVDLTLNLGLAGVAGFVALLGLGFLRGTNRFLRNESVGDAFVLSVIVYYCAVNMLGSRIFTPSLQTLLFYSVLTKLALEEIPMMDASRPRMSGHRIALQHDGLSPARPMQ